MFKKNLYLIVIFSMLTGQTTVNPNISAIGDLILSHDESSTTFSNSGLELAFQGYVNPFARANVFIHKHDSEEPTALEEAFLSVDRGLPLGLQIRAGRMRPEFGRLNREHSHLWPYILPSTPMQKILGPELWSGVGLELRYLLPFPWFSNITLGIFQNGIELSEEEETSTLDNTDHPSAINMRWSNFLDFSDITHGELGISLYQSDGENLMGLDYKLKWRPDTYRSLSLKGDIFFRKGEGDTTAIVGLSVINAQFSRIWNLGATIDYFHQEDQSSYASVGGFLGFSPAAESSVLRFMVKRIFHEGGDDSWQLVSQLIWSLGPHKPHKF
ncbi:MAG: hypothetical protein ACE5D0_04365 [Fidelibacterota bacterium]